jgi:hypothetical protein
MNLRQVKIITLLMALVGLGGCASVQPLSEEQKTIQTVVQVDGASQDKIYDGIKVWIAENFNSAKAVTEYDNKEQGRIIGNGITAYPCSGLDCMAKGDWKVYFTMRADVKDDKFRLTFTNIQIGWPAKYDSLGAHPAQQFPINQQEQVNDIKPVLLAFGDSIKASIHNPTNTSDW